MTKVIKFDDIIILKTIEKHKIAYVLVTIGNMKLKLGI